MATTSLPTGHFDQWSIASFKDSLLAALSADRSRGGELVMFFYAVTGSGWAEIESTVGNWLNGKPDRTSIAYVGTDHALTDPAALTSMSTAGVKVRLMTTYRGVYHPKAVLLKKRSSHKLWVGSNNLTRDGLSRNVELAVSFTFKQMPDDLRTWHESIRNSSKPFTAGLLRSYQTERQAFENTRAASKALTFTWSRKSEPASPPAQPTISPASGNLILEVMPKETGTDGRQVQVPVKAARSFFGIRTGTTRRQIRMKHLGDQKDKELTMTVFGNNTVRLSLSALEFRDRPCVLLFRKLQSSSFEYEIVSQNVFPDRYERLLELCTEQTRSGSRRWGVVE